MWEMWGWWVGVGVMFVPPGEVHAVPSSGWLFLLHPGGDGDGGGGVRANSQPDDMT